MNTLETWRSIIEVLGWALIHFTWQGTLVALSLAGVLRALRGTSTNTRYAAACVALLLMSSLPLFTIAIIGHSTRDKTASGPPPQIAAQPAPRPQPVEIEPTIVPTQPDIALASPRPWSFIRQVNITPLLPWMILLWLLGVAFFSLRLMGGWLYTQRLKSYGTRPLESRAPYIQASVSRRTGRYCAGRAEPTCRRAIDRRVEQWRPQRAQKRRLGDRRD